MATKLPKTYAQSMRITPKAIKPLAQAAGRHREARAQAQEDDARPHRIYLTRYQGLEALVEANKEKILKELSSLQSYDQVADWEVLAHLLAALPPAMLKRVFALSEIRELSVLFAKRPMRRLLSQNQGLVGVGIDWNRFQGAKKDMRFQLGHNNYKSSIALVLYLHVVRMSCDPKVQKDANFVEDLEVLKPANAVLDYVAESIIQHHRLAIDEFWGAPHRGRRGP
ncbi:MAG: hypothetical protein CMH56_07150 [Myxococcales bacterium]|nr:hypothetical protein [Myxococcales bacterium]|tara:strand:+ start:672 stop:1346 length:675 start_codon:yes stop_codon:yes gene_type:complete